MWFESQMVTINHKSSICIYRCCKGFIVTDIVKTIGIYNYYCFNYVSNYKTPSLKGIEFTFNLLGQVALEGFNKIIFVLNVLKYLVKPLFSAKPPERRFATEFTMPPSTLPRDKRPFLLRQLRWLAFQVGCTPIKKNVCHAVRTGRTYCDGGIFLTFTIYTRMYMVTFAAWEPLIKNRFCLGMLGHTACRNFLASWYGSAKKFRTFIFTLGCENEFANTGVLASERMMVRV